MNPRNFSIIAAFRSTDRGIGYENMIPWKKSNDLAFFRDETTKDCLVGEKNMVIMGRCTFESLNCKPLKHRINVVVTSQTTWSQSNDYPDTYFVSSLDKALGLNVPNCKINRRFVIGGEKLYCEAIQHPRCKELIINIICDVNNEISCDRFFPYIDYGLFRCNGTITSENGVVFTKYINKRI